MRSKKLFLALLSLGVLMLLSITAWAGMAAHVTMEGENQGTIEGSCDMKGREGTILVYAFGHSVKIPTDPGTGLPSGKRLHGPFKILKEFDKSSPKLYQALCTGERMTKVEIKFYQIANDGTEEHYFTITLENATILNISPSMPTVFLPENEPYRHMETVSFIYQKITWTWESDGIEYSDSWLEPKS